MKGAHDPWPYINYVLSIMKGAYRDLVDRVGALKLPPGEKRQMVIDGIEQLLARPGHAFKIRELEQLCPGVSRDMVRHVLREQQEQGVVSCSGRGAGAEWSQREGGNEGNQSP